MTLSAGDEEKTIGPVSDVIWDSEPPKVQRYNSTSPRRPKSDAFRLLSSPTYSVYRSNSERSPPPASRSLSRLPKARLSLRRAQQPQWEFMTPRTPGFNLSYAEGDTERSGRGIEG